MLSKLFLFLGCLSVQKTDAEMYVISQGQGLQLQGNFSIAGLFPLHYADEPSGDTPALGLCNE